MITMRFLCRYQLLTAGILIGMLAVGSVYGDPPHTAQQESDSTLVDVPLFDQEKRLHITVRSEDYLFPSAANKIAGRLCGGMWRTSSTLMWIV